LILLEVSSGGKGGVTEELKSRGYDFEDAGNRIYIFHIDAEESVRGLEKLAEGLKRRPATLEDVFLRLTGRSLLE
jgi:hypothetical protein